MKVGQEGGEREGVEDIKQCVKRRRRDEGKNGGKGRKEDNGEGENWKKDTGGGRGKEKGGQKGKDENQGRGREGEEEGAIYEYNGDITKAIDNDAGQLL